MRIMVGYDDYDESREVLSEAIKHAKAFKAEVMLVMSVTDNNKQYSEVVLYFDRVLNQGKIIFDENSIACTTHISYRAVDTTIGEDLVIFARTANVDAIFLGIRARSRIGKFLLGSVAQFVTLSADCPVVGVKKIRAK